MWTTTVTLSAILLLVWTVAIGARRVMRGVADYRHVNAEWEWAERQLEVHWACVHLRVKGFDGDDLHERLCQMTNCSPTEASEAVMRTHESAA